MLIKDTFSWAQICILNLLRCELLANENEVNVRILFIVSAFNGLSQHAYVELESRGHDVSVELALNDSIVKEAVARYKPQIILCPFLKEKVPDDIWRKETCIIIHPGIKGDRGPSSLDWAITQNVATWGVTALEAAEEMDAGSIWATANFPMRLSSKASIYRQEVTEAAVKVILETVEKFEKGNFVPEPLDYSKKDVKGELRPLMKQKDRFIDWFIDSTQNIIRKINAADSFPGVLDTICGKQYYLYGVHEEVNLKGKPGEIIAKRYGAICRATVDGAVWISHLRKRKEGSQKFFKLPAATVLADVVGRIPESPIELLYTGTAKTFREIWYEQKNNVGYLYFDFHNGAMSTEQCIRLQKAFTLACQQSTKVIVLMGGIDSWSNGIHLNIIEAAKDPADESWQNINAINDLIYTILTTESHLTISAVQGNAGAGGVKFALASDKVYIRAGRVLNPYYKAVGLYGSEYWTYSLPRRVGSAKAQELTSKCLPLGSKEAKAISLVDDVFSGDVIKFREQITQAAEHLANSSCYEKRITEKRERRRLDEQAKPLSEYRTAELAEMEKNFSSPEYQQARYNFVYKIRPQKTPTDLAKHR